MFPVSEEEIDRISVKEKNGQKEITLKTYGLPMVFWGYLAAILTVIGAMYIAIEDPIEKLIQTGDSINMLLGHSVKTLMIAGPILLISAYFYEVFITKCDKEIVITHRVFFGLLKYSRKLKLESKNSLSVEHHMDSPNVAKMKNDPSLRGFENKGFYQLWATLDNGKSVVIDKAARKIDLVKIKEILSRY